MGNNHFSRRGFIAAAGALMAGATLPKTARARGKSRSEFTYCLNTATIRGQKLPIEKEIEIAAKAGYDGIEPWLDGIGRYKDSGGSLKDLKKRAQDLGLSVESAISFPSWISDDDEQRAKAFEQARREMDALSQIGGKRIAAPPAGATREPGLDLDKAAERYRKLLELGDEFGVVPQIELWGFSKNLFTIAQCMHVVIGSGHPKACLMPDVFHIYNGGGGFSGLKHVSAETIQVFHMNDYPAEPPRGQIRDSDRVFTGDGVAPITEIIRDLLAKDSHAVLSLELFNPKYYKQDPLEVAKTGLGKMKESVAKAMQSS
ncbi:MAG: sugar phosphate isomerase/epimerase [Sedimentisphaerales bacterium]|nr:sugar phosphate isomerase/epimerase [Sedimentisphaerales bacterium]